MNIKEKIIEILAIITAIPITIIFYITISILIIIDKITGGKIK